MPLPQFLSSTYKRYKSDTDRFATWLAETAEACTKANASLTPAPQPAPISARKYKVALKDFTSFAEIIAQHNAQSPERQVPPLTNRITIPPSIIGFARRAIQLRKRFAARFAAKVNGALSNKGHVHFISVLEQALRILRVPEESSRTSTSQPATTTPAVDEQGLTEASNRFSTLVLEEPSGLGEGRESKKVKTHISEDIKYELEDEFDDDNEAIMLACFCLLDDLNNIREFLTQTWSDYRQGKADLMSVSATTDTALTLAKQAIEQTERIPGLPMGGGKLQNVVYATLCILHGYSPFMAQQSGDPFDMATLDFADFCYLGTSILLRSFCDVITPGREVPQYKKGYFGNYDPTQDRSKMSAPERFTEDKIVLLQAMQDFVFLTKFKIPIPGEDTFTKGVREMVKTKQVSLWLSFAAQIYLDIHHTLRANVGKAFQELRLTGLRTKKILDDYFTFSRTMNSPTWLKENDDDLKDIQNTVEAFIVKDIFLVTKPKSFPITKEDEFSFLKWHPLQAGLLMFNINLRMQYVGISLVNAWGSVIYLAYFYNTVQKEGMVSVDWPDMDKITEYHTEERIFIGGKPTDITGSYKKLCLVLGCSPESFAGKGVVHSKSGPRGLEESTTVSKLFLDCYAQGGSLDLSMANISSLLNDLAQSEHSKQSSGLLKRKWQATSTLSPLQLLAALRQKLIDEEPRLIFNYFGMHKRGIELMRTIRVAINDKLTQYFGPKYLDGEHQLPTMIMYMYHVALNSAKASKMMGLIPAGGKGGSVLMMKAGKVMQEYLRVNGSVACKELKVFCKNEKHTKEEAVREGNRREENAQFWFTLEEIIDPATMASLQTGIGF